MTAYHDAVWGEPDYLFRFTLESLNHSQVVVLDFSLSRLVCLAEMLLAWWVPFCQKTHKNASSSNRGERGDTLTSSPCFSCPCSVYAVHLSIPPNQIGTDRSQVVVTSSGLRLFGEACSLALHSAPARVLVDAVTSQVCFNADLTFIYCLSEVHDLFKLLRVPGILFFFFFSS